MARLRQASTCPLASGLWRPREAPGGQLRGAEERRELGIVWAMVAMLDAGLACVQLSGGGTGRGTGRGTCAPG